MAIEPSKELLLRTTALGIEQRVGGGRYVKEAIAAVKAIYEIYKALSSISDKAKKAKALAEISKQLSAIIKQLGDINRKLDRIYEKLDEIEEKIEQTPWKAAALDNAGARETIAENFEHWSSAEATSEDLRDARNAKARIARNTRILMAGQKMAYIYDVILSYVFELNLDLLLETPDSTLINASNKLTKYLEDALDGDIEGSIRYYLNASLPEYEKLLEQEARLDREDYIGTTYMKTQENKYGYVRCEFRVFEVIKGSLKGHDLRRLTENREIEGSCVAYNYPKEQYPREASEDLRAVPSHGLIKDMLERFISHETVVEFTTEVLPEIEKTIELIKDRVEAQLNVEED